MAVTMKSAVLGDVGRVTLVKTEVSEDRFATIIKVSRIGELETTLAVTSNPSTVRRNISSRRASVASYC
jgi:hypothetical protein